MKRVFSRSDHVIHLWAQQNQDDGRCSNVHFDGPVLYSYSTPIALFVSRTVPYGPSVSTRYQERVCVLHTIKKYSVTTSRHQADALRATSQYHRFHVLRSDVGADMHAENIRDYQERYAALSQRTYRSTDNMEHYLRGCYGLREEVDRYAEFFGLQFSPELFPLLDEEKLNKARSRMEKQAIANAAKQKERDAYFALSNEEKIQAFLAGTTFDLPYNWEIGIDDTVHTQVMELAKDNWRNHKGNYGTFRDTILLRLKNKTTIETSQGAQFPISDAIRAFPLIRYAMERRPFIAEYPNKTIKLGAFTVDSISIDGTVHAGCHVVRYSEILLMAQKLGIVDVTQETVAV